MIRHAGVTLAVVLAIGVTVVWIVAAAREGDRKRQACAARGGTMVQTGTRLVPAGKAVFVPVFEYTCKGATR